MNDLIFYGSILFLIIAITLVASSLTCSARWEHSGFEADYGPIKGCVIKVSDNKWIPEDRYREVDQ